MDPLRVGVLGGWGRRIGGDGDDDAIILLDADAWRNVGRAVGLP